MTHSAQLDLTKSRLYTTVLAMATIPLFGASATGQYNASMGATAVMRQVGAPVQPVMLLEACRAAPPPTKCSM